MTLDEREAEIHRRVVAERRRLEAAAGLDASAPAHFHRPSERRSPPAERDHVTILFGGLTWKHEELVRAVFEGSGLPMRGPAGAGRRRLTSSDGSTGTSDNAIRPTSPSARSSSICAASRRTASRGRTSSTTTSSSRPARAARAGSACTRPSTASRCRTPGSTGSACSLFQQDDGLKATSGEPGLKFTVDFGMGALMAFTLGDVIHQLAYRIRPYEVAAGETDRVMRAGGRAAGSPRAGPRAVRDPATCLPSLAGNASPARRQAQRLLQYARQNPRAPVRRARCSTRSARFVGSLDAIEVDRLRVKPVVKTTGEFWAQTTESAGNFDMFAFLESRGAEVLVDPIGSWVMYLLFQERLVADMRRGLDLPAGSRWRTRSLFVASELRYRGRRLLFTAGERLWAWQYHRLVDALGGLAHRLARAGGAGPARRALLQPARARRRGPPRSGEDRLSHRASPLSHGAEPEAVRLPAVDAVRRRAVGRGEPFQGHHLSADRDRRRRRGARAQPRADGARRRQGAGTPRIRRGRSPEPASGSTISARTSASTKTSASRSIAVPHHPGVAGSAANFVLHVSDLMDRRRRLAATVWSRSCRPSSRRDQPALALPRRHRHRLDDHQGRGRRIRIGPASSGRTTSVTRRDSRNSCWRSCGASRPTSASRPPTRASS